MSSVTTLWDLLHREFSVCRVGAERARPGPRHRGSRRVNMVQPAAGPNCLWPLVTELEDHWFASVHFYSSELLWPLKWGGLEISWALQMALRQCSYKSNGWAALSVWWRPTRRDWQWWFWQHCRAEKITNNCLSFFYLILLILKWNNAFFLINSLHYITNFFILVFHQLNMFFEKLNRIWILNLS